MTVTAPARATRFNVNGSQVEIEGPGGLRLLDALRIELGLTVVMLALYAWPGV